MSAAVSATTLLVAFTIPIRTVSEANKRGHWAGKANRAKAQRFAANAHALAHLDARTRKLLLDGACMVTLTRVAPRALDSDNLATSQKAIRDGIADALSIDDRDERVTWQYAQYKGEPGQYCVDVEIRRRA